MTHPATYSGAAASESRSAHSSDSSLREKIIEHAFVAELLRTLWRRGQRDVEVSGAEVDRGGYDVVFHCNGVMRHVQLAIRSLDVRNRGSTAVSAPETAKFCHRSNTHHFDAVEGSS